MLGRHVESNGIRPSFRRAVESRNYDGYYVKVARKTGSRHFNIPAQHYNKMTKVERWRANRKFLDRAIARGDKFRLSSRLHQAKPGSGYAREIAYLRSKGYQVSRNGRWMVAPKSKRTIFDKPERKHEPPKPKF